MEPIEILNQRLTDYYGLFEEGSPRFRLVWSDDQFEKRATKYTESGLELAFPEIRLLPKYFWIHAKYVLEILVPVPASVETDLITKLTYEPLWVFEDAGGNPLIPIWEAIEVLIKTARENMHSPMKQYKEPEIEKNTPEAIEARAKAMEKLLYGNETSVGDSLMQDTAVGYGVRKRNDSKFN